MSTLLNPFEAKKSALSIIEKGVSGITNEPSGVELTLKLTSSLSEKNVKS